MRVFYGFDCLPRFRRAVATVGSFDGLHIGHRALLDRVRSEAVAEDGESVVITFSPHPRQVIEGKECVKLLNTLNEKIFLLRQIGIDNLIVIPFTLEFSRHTPDEFIRNYLVGKVHIHSLIVGYNHHFGHDKQGGTDQLEALQRQLGFTVKQMSQLKMDEQKVSSTEIRSLVAQGDMATVARMLARPYMIIADIYKHKVLSDTDEKLLPCSGTYQVTVNGLADRATIDEGTVVLEATEVAGEAVIEFV